MNLVRLTDIRISPDRQRRDFSIEKLNELRESIQTHGLFSPPILREDAGHLYLVAGERRIRAITDLYDLGGTFRHDDEAIEEGYIPYIALGELGEVEREEAELEENIRRQDLSWQEKAAATARLTKLRAAQAVTLGLPPPSNLAIALELKDDLQDPKYIREVVRQETIVAKNLHKPEIAGAKSVAEAFKMLKREEQQTKHRELAASVGLTFGADQHQLHNVDAVQWLAECPDESFEVILTDPPYGMGADSFRDSGGELGGNAQLSDGGHSYTDDEETFRYCVDALILHSYRIAAAQAHLYVFCDIDNFAYLRSEFRTAGWWVHRTPLIWDKVHGSRVPWPENGPRRNYEMILYAVKGRRPVTVIAPDILPYRSDANLDHGAQKPVALYTELLKRSIRPGDSVLDCFGGTGPILEAADALKCTATYIEQDPTYFGIAVARVKRLKAQLKLEV